MILFPLQEKFEDIVEVIISYKLKDIQYKAKRHMSNRQIMIDSTQKTKD